MSNFWHKKRILVTGGSGFVGTHLLAELRQAGAIEIAAPRRAEYDLRVMEDVRRLITTTRPEVVVHLAALVGGIGANQANPATFFYDNALMGLQLMEQARLHDVSKYVGIGTICAYPKLTPTPFKEEDLWNGYPEETNAPYGLAKKMLMVQGQAYRQQYGFNAIHLLIVNLYGPGDHFEAASSHVIPAMISRFVEARRSNRKRVTLWGTGRPTREFLYVRDAARAIRQAAERYDSPEPINVGSGFEISIRELAELVAELVGYTGTIVWDQTKPDGQPRRRLDVSRAEREFGFRATTDFDLGLRETVRWYLETGDRMSEKAVPLTLRAPA